MNLNRKNLFRFCFLCMLFPAAGPLAGVVEGEIKGGKIRGNTFSLTSGEVIVDSPKFVLGKEVFDIAVIQGHNAPPLSEDTAVCQALKLGEAIDEKSLSKPIQGDPLVAVLHAGYKMGYVHSNRDVEYVRVPSLISIMWSKEPGNIWVSTRRSDWKRIYTSIICDNKKF